jgi:hypothetical protein
MRINFLTAIFSRGGGWPMKREKRSIEQKWHEMAEAAKKEAQKLPF